VVLVYLQPFRRNLLLKCALQQKLPKKFTKPPFWGVQGRLRPSTLTNLKSPSPLLVTMWSTIVPICNRFHTIRANRGKITFFKRDTPLWRPFEGNPLTQGHEILSLKTRVLGAAHSEDFVMLACTVLIQITSVTDGQTPRRWLRRAKYSASARKMSIQSDRSAFTILAMFTDAPHIGCILRFASDFLRYYLSHCYSIALDGL